MLHPYASVIQFVVSPTKPTITVIDPGMGNLRSVCRAWEHAGADVRLAANARELGQPQAMVFPGQGGMIHIMRELQARGFDTAITEWIADQKPFFGICLGMQALFSFSEEGNSKGLGVFEGSVKRFQLPPDNKIPHMGWNQAHFVQRTLCDASLNDASDQFYFVHSYYVEPADSDLIWCETTYGSKRFTSGIRWKNGFATQFHPEKSQAKGLQIYRNFVHML